MEIQSIQQGSQEIAAIYSPTPIIIDLQTGLDVLTNAQYRYSNSIVINKEAFSEDFFSLKTGIAGDVLQKCVTYHIQLAIYGDFAPYTSKALRDFMRESNRGPHVFFATSKEEAVNHLFER